MFRISDGKHPPVFAWANFASRAIRDWYKDHTDEDEGLVGARYYEVVGGVPEPDVGEEQDSLRRYASEIRRALEAATNGRVIVTLEIEEMVEIPSCARSRPSAGANVKDPGNP